MPTLSEFYADKVARNLKGATIIDAFVEPPNEYDDDGFWGFQVRTKDGKLLDVWVNRDGEANGPGAISIEPSPPK